MERKTLPIPLFFELANAPLYSDLQAKDEH